MKAEFIKRENNDVTLKIAIDNIQFEEAINKTYNKSKGKYNIPGFRKGKAPRKIIEAQYGKGVFYNDAIDMLFPEVYPAALKELNIEPVDRPELDIEELSEDNGLVMVVKVAVKPEVKLGNYKGIEVSKVEYNVTDEEINSRLEDMRNRNSRLVTVEGRPVQEGDTAIIDFKGFVDGEAFEGGEGNNYNLEIGSGTFIPGFEEQLVGVNVGEEVDVNVNFPEEYHAPNLAAKPAVFKVTVNDIKVKELPELNDEFAKDVSEFETLEELKADVRKNLEESNSKKAEGELRNRVVDKVAETVEMDVPEAMVQTQIDNMLMELDYQLQMQGLNLQQLLQMSGKTIEELKTERRPEAEKLVKSSLILEAIAKAENIEVSDEDLEKEIEEMGKMYNMEVAQLKSSLRDADIEDIKGQLAIRKTIDLIVNSANIA
jgi:trigger factor